MRLRPTGDRPNIAVIDPPFAGALSPVLPSEVDLAIARLAHRQSGVVSRLQLIDLGLSPEAVSRRLFKGSLHRLVDGVYAVGHDRVSREGRWAAALLFAGPTACLSHRTALLLWGIDKGPGRVEVIRDFNRTNPRRANTRDKWLAVHRTRYLPERDLTRRNGFPVTTVARAMLDLTPRLTEIQLRDFLAAAKRKGLANHADFGDILDRGSGHQGIARLRRAVNEWDPSIAATKSNVEALFLRLRKKYGIPAPDVNVDVGGFEVDCLWPDRRVIVELDTYTYHGDPVAFEKDRNRDLILEGMGFRVLRITAVMLENQEERVMSTLRSLLCA